MTPTNFPNARFLCLGKTPVTRDNGVAGVKYLIYNTEHNRYWVTTIPVPRSIEERNATIERQYNASRTTPSLGQQFNPAWHFPEYEEGWKICEDPWRSDTFVKVQHMLERNRWITDYYTAYNCTRKELHNLKRLQGIPQHNNLCEYKGVVTDQSQTRRVFGIAYEKYDCDLFNWTMDHNKPFDTKLIIEVVGRALQHLHKYGLVHCDVKPENVFIKGEGEILKIALGDFDSMHRVGETLMTKIGTRYFWNEKYAVGDKAVVELDIFALGKLKKWLERVEIMRGNRRRRAKH
ncbi:kinase-like protein [Amniculicola lignicola CBS 123094]|uniref:Kinase-like protein n=1 Tax=Amniculicola lignicola CBS 123094 TaxID=1392246 RepID=A0A6A5WCU6_9PLEO|nr:kinase-like protein [Amniculicola lignicola CBS 123094]